MSDRILALDLGTHVGWCTMTDGLVIEARTRLFPLIRGDNGNGVRFSMFCAWAFPLLSAARPSLCVYEMAHYRGRPATEILVGMSTRIEEYCAYLSIRVEGIHSQTLKKWATGSGKSGKPEMIAAASNIYPGHDLNEHEADAILLAAYANKKINLDNR